MPEERYSKEAVKRAGKLLTSGQSSKEEAAQARKVVDYWRSIHAEALQRALADIESSTIDTASALVAGRIKKYDTIIGKLGRLRTARLHTLHDIAGCRIVVPSLNDLLHISNTLSRLACFDADK